MEVVLLTDIKGTGRRGERKTVSDGYYRNFLMPRRLAAAANEPAARAALNQIEASKAKEVAEVAALRRQAAVVDGQTVELRAKAQGTGEGARLFGAVREAEVAAALSLDKRLIAMAPIKSVGSHPVELRFGNGITARVLVKVVAA